jgi:hypothetical protein
LKRTLPSTPPIKTCLRTNSVSHVLGSGEVWGVSNGFANEALAIELRPLDSRVHATEPRGGDHALSFLVERCSDIGTVSRAQLTNLRTYPTWSDRP